jgi:hypothetical protein
MRVAPSIVSALAGGLLALAGLTYAQSHAPAPSIMASAAAATPAPPVATLATVTRKAELRTTLRRLFEERVAYTRNAIISVLGNTPDLDAVTVRLMKNQDDIGNALRPYYGDDAATRLSALLKDHVTLGVAAIKAAKTGEKGKLAAAEKNWSDNGSAIAAFLSATNPNWQKTAVEQTLQKHADITKRDVTARLVRDWAADIKDYDDSHQQMLAFADMLADGIVKQFPAKFAG